MLLESRGLVQRSRARGEGVDRVRARLDASTFEDFDPTGFADTAALLRRGAALLTHDDSGRREALEEYAALHDVLAEKFPLLKEEWLARRASLRGIDLLGANGAGKTTAINILTTLLTPDAGTVRVAGYDVVTEADRVRASIGVTGQFARG